MSGIAIFSANHQAAGDPVVADRGSLLLQPSRAQLRLEGEMGRRVEVTINQWLIPAWDANPALTQMYRLRDRNPPYLKPVPWAGEFAGKHLISAVQLHRMSGDPHLGAMIDSFVSDLIATQDADGYMGPFNRDERLLKYWDLWNHYHVMLGLYQYYLDTGSRPALDAATRAADLACSIYLDSGRKVHEAGDYEMNMAIIHVLGMLHRETGNPRYYQLMLAIKQDWEHPGAGDYYRQALAGREFFQTPRPRWESLHDLQGLTELYRISGDATYREALLHFWHSILKTDIHNSGSFSIGEGAVGNPFRPGAIETCCTVAWIALSIDALALAGDSRIADAIELATWNTVLGYQHPSGRWSTYDTPMDGRRQASAHEIVFQARAGSPELNCCSVNAPRGIGMLSEWAVMAAADGLSVNYYGPGQITLADPHGTTWTLTQTTDYPRDGVVRLRVDPSQTIQAKLRFRIPQWSTQTKALLNGQPVAEATPGTYLEIQRTWQAGDTLDFTFDMTLHTQRGDQNVDLKTSIYRGPLLLAYDQAHNDFDFDQFPELDLKTINYKPVAAHTRIAPLVLYAFTAADGRSVNLCDYASAGSMGTSYHSWLPVRDTTPAAFFLQRPLDAVTLPSQNVALRWGQAGEGVQYELTVAKDRSMQTVIQHFTDLEQPRFTLSEPLDGGQTYYWQVQARNAQGTLPSHNGPWSFTIDTNLSTSHEGLVLRLPLDGTGAPQIGTLLEEHGLAAAADRFGTAGQAVAFNGVDSKLRFATPGGFPDENYTLLGWFQPQGLDPANSGMREVFDSWCRVFDTPLRLNIIGETFKVQVESGKAYGTQGVRLQNGQWYHIGVIKAGPRLTVYFNGKLLEEIEVPAQLESSAQDLGIGFNPHWSQGEFFHGAIDDIALYERALSEIEVLEHYNAPQNKQVILHQPTASRNEAG